MVHTLPRPYPPIIRQFRTTSQLHCMEQSICLLWKLVFTHHHWPTLTVPSAAHLYHDFPGPCPTG